MFGNLSTWANRLVEEASTTMTTVTTTINTVSSKMESVLDSHVPEIHNNLASTGQTTNTKSQKEVAWEDVPGPWVGRESDWSQLALLILHDVNTFLVDPSRVPPGEGIDTQWSEIALTPDVVAQCVHATTLCPILHQRRFDLVPKWTTEPHFWSCYFWRLRELGRSDGTVQTITSLLQRVNTETQVGSNRKKNFGVGDNKEILRDIIAKYAKWVDTRMKTDALVNTAKEDMRGARDNIRLLSSLNDHSDVELRESIYQSCRYQKQKVGARIAELSGFLSQLRDSAVPEVHCGAVDVITSAVEDTIVELHSVNEALNQQLRSECTRVVGTKTNVDESPGVHHASSTSGQNNSNGNEGGVTPGLSNAGNSPRNENASGSPATGSGAVAINDDYFTAKLPWDDDK